VLFCVDPNHLDITAPGGYNVEVSANGAGNNALQALNLVGTVVPTSHTLSAAALGAGFTTASDLYGGLAYLSHQLLVTSDKLLQQEYQAAIWQLGDYTSTFAVVNAPAGFDLTLVSTFEHDAFTNRLTSGFSVLMDVNEVANGKNAAQEYIILTPEPGSLMLSASGVLGFLLMRRRKVADRSRA